jgi:three-Cys-motif partner protein
LTTQVLVDDELYTPTVGSWAQRKYELLAYYCRLFSSSMAGKWQCRVYIDLFAGPGRARVKPTRQIIHTSPTIALGTSPPFDHHVFCDVDPTCVSTLQSRIRRDFPTSSVSYVAGDSNTAVADVMSAIPAASKTHKVLSFCFVDPFRLQNLHFDTIRHLAERFVDFLVLIPAYMDARRNLSAYLQPSSTTIERFLGLSDWRAKWASRTQPSMNFGAFVADQFGEQMKTLRYQYAGLADTVLVRYPRKNVALYRLAFFSRSPVGARFWQEAQKYTDSQLPLFQPGV